MSDGLVVLVKYAVALALVWVLVAVNTPVRPVVVSLVEEPHYLPPVLAVRAGPELSHPVGSREVVASLRHVGLHTIHGRLEEGVGQVGDDGAEGVDVAGVD